MITNNQELSEGMFKALTHDEYSKGEADFSATELITPSRIIALARRNKERLTEDASDLVYRILGRSVHSLIDNARKSIAGDNHELRTEYIMKVLGDYSAGEIQTSALPDAINEAVKTADNDAVFKATGLEFESRKFVVIPIDGIKIILSGQLDYFDTKSGEIRDYKVTSRWVSADGAKDEWEKQMNIYAYILRMHGRTPQRAVIEAIYRDWSKTQAARDKSYPQKQIEQFEITLWSAEVAEAYVIGRIRSHLRAIAEQNEPKIEVCSKDERWERNEQFAVTKPGRTRAIRVLDTNEDALVWIGKNKRVDEIMSIEHRPGQSVRCESYCPVKEFCSFHKYFTER
jgi:hypothetical protein